MNQPGLFRGIFDGRYKFARYFRPSEYHIPKDWEALLAHNQLELYDTEADPDEINNLAAQPDAHRELIESLNAKTNQLILDEIGADDGSTNPGPAWLYRL
jgi:arylsulfatase